MTYKCEFFKIQELVPRKVYEERGESAWELLDDRLLMQLDALRRNFGPITLNDWHLGGTRQWQVLRTPDSPDYTPYSQHTFGRAADCKLQLPHTARDVRRLIRADRHNPIFRYVKAIELNVSWLHIDVRNCDRIKCFNPK